MKSNWTSFKFKSILKEPIRDFGSFSLTNLITFQDNGVPFLKSEAIQNGYIDFSKISYISAEVHKLLHKSIVKEGDLLYTKIGAICRGAIYNGKLGICNSNAATAKIVIDQEIADKYYVLYLLLSEKIKREFEKSIISTPPRINLGDIDKLEVHLPPLPQQQKIAKILSTCDTVIEQTEAAIAKYQALKQGMMHDLFTRGIDTKTGKLRPKQTDAPELYKQSKLGWVPKEWVVINFQEATEIITDFTANGSFESLRVNVKYYYELNYGRLIRLTDLRQNLKNDGVYVNRDGFDFLLKSELKENDIMLANVGEYTGFACLMPKVNYPATIAPNMFLVRANTEIVNSLYLYYFMIFPNFTNQVDNVSASSATKLLNKTNFRAMNLFKPSLEEQIKIGDILSNIDKKLKTEQSTLSKYKQIKSGLMQDLLSGKVEVKV